MNPWGIVLLVGGVVAILVGVRGTQSQVFQVITGHSATGPTSPVTQVPAGADFPGSPPEGMMQPPTRTAP